MCDVVCCTASSYDNFTCLLPLIRCTQYLSATRTTPIMLRVKWTGAGRVLSAANVRPTVWCTVPCDLQLIVLSCNLYMMATTDTMHATPQRNTTGSYYAASPMDWGRCVAFCVRPMCAPRCAVLCTASCSSLCSLAVVSPFARCNPTRTVELAATTLNARSPWHVCVRCWARPRPCGSRALWCPMHLGTGCGAAPLLPLCRHKPSCHCIGTGSLPTGSTPSS